MEVWQELGGKSKSVCLRSVHAAFDISAIFGDHQTRDGGTRGGGMTVHVERTTCVEATKARNVDKYQDSKAGG